MTRRTDSFVRYHVGLREDLAARHYSSVPQPGEVRTLKRRMASLRRSFNGDDKVAVKRIDSTFIRTDSDAANNSLRLHYPADTENRTITEWIQRGHDADVAAFCVWNMARTRRLRETLRQDWPSMATDIMEKTEHLVDINLFPAHAPAVMNGALRNSSFHAMDSFQSGGWNAAGFYIDQHRPSVTLANLYDDKTEMTGTSIELSRVAFHEYMHAAGHLGGFDPISGPPLRPIEEAFVEHTTVVAHGGLAPFQRTINPRMRPNDANEYSTYHPERTLLGMTGVAPEQLAEVYFSPRASERGEWLREDLYRKFGAAFGSTERFFAFIDEYEHSQKTKRNKLVYKTIETLAPLPEPEIIPSNEITGPIPIITVPEPA